jgi:hypothetical protein
VPSTPESAVASSALGGNTDIDFEEHVYTDNNNVSADLVELWIHLQ